MVVATVSPLRDLVAVEEVVKVHGVATLRPPPPPIAPPPSASVLPRPSAAATSDPPPAPRRASSSGGRENTKPSTFGVTVIHDRAPDPHQPHRATSRPCRCFEYLVVEVLEMDGSAARDNKKQPLSHPAACSRLPDAPSPWTRPLPSLTLATTPFSVIPAPIAGSLKGERPLPLAGVIWRSTQLRSNFLDNGECKPLEFIIGVFGPRCSKQFNMPWKHMVMSMVDGCGCDGYDRWLAKIYDIAMCRLLHQNCILVWLHDATLEMKKALLALTSSHHMLSTTLLGARQGNIQI